MRYAEHFQVPARGPGASRRRGARHIALGTVSALAMTVAGGVVHTAQAAINEILVTAEKRAAAVALQDVPVSISAYSGADLESLLANEFTDIAVRVPSLAVQDLGPGDSEFIIRGVNSRGQATTGVYYDEAIITARTKQDGGGRQALIELHDLQRVEVLKGPQGTLYGASSMGGLIRFIPNQPDASQFEGRVEGEGSYTEKGEGNYHFDGMINVPLVQDKLAIRAVGWFTREGGYIDNVRLNQDNINNNDVEGVRIAARWQPVPEAAITAYVVYQNRDVGGSSRYNKGMLEPGFVTDLVLNGFPVFPVGDLQNQEFTVNNWNEELKIYSIKAEYDAGWGSFLATSNLFRRDVDFRFDSTPILLFFGAPAEALTFEPQSREVWSNEIRFSSNFDGPFNFVVGGFLLREDKDFEVQVIATNNLGLPMGAFDVTEDFFLGTGPAIFGRQKTDDLNQEAVFGEFTFDVTEDLQVLFGVRYFQYDIKSKARETKPFVGFPPSVNPLVPFKQDDSKTTFKGRVSYNLTPDQMVYFVASQGFRVGGTNENFINPGGAVIPEGFGPDTLWNYEVGAKTAWYEDRLIVNGAFYYIRWKDIQVGNFDPDSPFPFIDNGGKAAIKGVELEVQAQPMDGLDLFFGGSYQNAELTQDFAGAFAVLGRDGDRIPNVPKFQAAASAQYTWPAWGDVNGLARVDLTYRGSTDTTFRASASPRNVKLDSYVLVNLKAGVQGENWQVSAFVKNVGDKRAEVDAINSSQDPLAFLTVRPRTFGVNFSRTF